ncbi:MAG: HEAT repeat domain-containing protein [Magnetococcales bacterium]|nr:HEAT repeat domain-containing protein [Magnetococcales bacterium]
MKWNSKWILALVVVLLAIPGLLWWMPKTTTAPVTDTSAPPAATTAATTAAEPTPQPSIRLRFSPENGQIQAWRFGVHSKAMIDFAILQPKISGAPPPTQGKPIPVESGINGELYLKFHLREEGLWNVAGLIQDLDYRINGEKPMIATAMTEPFTFAMTNQGVLQEFHFTRGVPDQANQLIQNILLGMQIVLPKEAQNSWSTTETDMTGRFQAAYQISKLSGKENSITIIKNKKSYVALNSSLTGFNPAIANSTVLLTGTSGKATMVIKGPWLTSMEYKEKLTMVAGGYEWSTADNETSLAHIERNTTGLFPETFAEYVARLQSNRYLATKYYVTDPTLNQMGSGLNIEGAMELFKRLRSEKDSTARRNAEQFMVNYLRQHPEACATLIALMDQDPNRERVDQETQLTFWRLLTKTGHPEAQQALINAITGAGLTEVTQMRALTNIHAFENPQPFLADELYRYYKRPPTPTDGDRDPQKRQMALLALGAMGYKDKLNEETRNRVGQLLQDHIGTTQTIPEQLDVLNAIGNYGGKEMMPKIEPYLGSQDEYVRASAFSSMRRMDDPAVLTSIIEHYDKEDSAKVRTVALKTIAELPPSQAGMTWVNQNAMTPRHPEEQIIMVDMLGKHEKLFPANSQTLRELLKTNPDNRVKKAIYKYVVPGQ